MFCINHLPNTCKNILLICLTVLLSSKGYSSDPPNIIVLFADDAGYADFGFQGSEVMQTPHLDKLAQEGVRFTQGYVTDATCGPSRAGLLTGKYQQRFGFEENNVPGYMSASSAHLGDEMGLPTDQKTMGDYLQSLGYRTAIFGKWHQGGADRYHPLKRGFDEFYGFRGGARSYFAYQGEPKTHQNKLEMGFEVYQEPQEYITDDWARAAVEFIEKNKDRPFFAFVSFNAVHTPMDALEKDLAKFPNLTGTRKKVAAMTWALDRACGRILSTLEELNLANNTIVVFTNDNGGPSDRNGSINWPLAGTKSNHLEGGIRVPFLMRWPGKIAPQSVYTSPISTMDLLPTFYVAGGGQVDSTFGWDGVNLIPFLSGEKAERPHQRLFWKKDCRAVVREGDWKLLRFADRPPELYNLSEDISEQNNLAAVHPQKVKHLFKVIFDWESTLARPLWMLQRKYENYDIERMDQYRKVP